MDDDYHNKLEQNRLKAEVKTAKNRAKRQKKKQQQKQKKKIKLQETRQESSSQSESDSESENCDITDGVQNVSVDDNNLKTVESKSHKDTENYNFDNEAPGHKEVERNQDGTARQENDELS